MKRFLARLDRYQQSHQWLAMPVAVFKKYSDDRGGRLGAVVAYYAFFSVFPALLAMVAITGFMLDRRPELRDDIVDSAIGSFPVIGENIAGAGLGGSGFALVVGLATALWAGSGAMLATEYAFNVVWDVPLDERVTGLKARVKGVAMLGLFGLATVGATVLTNLVTRLALPGLAVAGIVAANLTVDILAGWLAFQILTSRRRPWRSLLPGAILAGTGFFVLQHLGSFVIDRYIENASDTYGTFAVVIGLLTWFHLLAQVTLVGAEVNVVREYELYPRALLDSPPEPEQPAESS